MKSTDRPVLVASDVEAGLVRMSDGTELPITYGSLSEALRHKWYSPIDSTFNAIFYAALKSVGVLLVEARADIGLLSHHRRALGLSASQLRGAYGLEKGVFTSAARFLDSRWERDLLEARIKQGNGGRHRGPFAGNLEVWNQIERDGSLACRGKLDQVNIDVEFRWIRANLAEWPDFGKAPSSGAIKDWLEINRPGNESLKRDFLKLAWTRRLAPGDRRSASRKSVFKEDAVEDKFLSDYDRELEERLAEIGGACDEEVKADGEEIEGAGAGGGAESGG